MAEKKTKWQPPRQVKSQDAAIIEEIGKKLKKLRERQGLSIHAFIKDLDVSRTGYTQMEGGSVYFNIRNLLVLINQHGLDLKTFIETDLENL